METINKTELQPIVVKTTLPALPYPPLESRPVIKTERLLIRPYLAEDLDALHALRTQPEVMEWMPKGQIDVDIGKTKALLEKKLKGDEENYSCVICLASTGQLIGVGGSHSRVGILGWPDVGYMLRREFWGRGYGTEFLKGFLEAWWALPRCEVSLTVDGSTVDEGATAVGQRVKERTIAFTREDNMASRKVASKAGMRLVKVWQVVDMRDGKTAIHLLAYAAKRAGRR